MFFASWELRPIFFCEWENMDNQGVQSRTFPNEWFCAVWLHRACTASDGISAIRQTFRSLERPLCFALPHSAGARCLEGSCLEENTHALIIGSPFGSPAWSTILPSTNRSSSPPASAWKSFKRLPATRSSPYRNERANLIGLVLGCINCSPNKCWFCPFLPPLPAVLFNRAKEYLTGSCQPS